MEVRFPNHLTLTSINVWGNQIVTMVPVRLRVGSQHPIDRLSPVQTQTAFTLQMCDLQLHQVSIFWGQGIRLG